MKRVDGFKLPLGENLEKQLRLAHPWLSHFRILKKSLDARKKSDLHHVYSIELYAEGEQVPEPQISSPSPVGADTRKRVVVIGAGPAGLFSALWLTEAGVPCTLLERGKPVIPRMKDIAKHWRHGQIQPDSNVCFGEGGAGAFSDGKLVTRIKSPFKQFVLEQMVRFGAPDNVVYEAAPHVGSNRIRSIIRNLTSYLIEKGCDVRFDARVERLDFVDGNLSGVELRGGELLETPYCVLAAGHSAHDVFQQLFEAGVDVEAMNIAMGFRIEHSQRWLNEAQFGRQWNHPELPVASYKLAVQDKEDSLGTYSFCMCPGGYVLASSAQKGQMVVNGMSNSNHGSPYANSGLVVTIKASEWYPEGAQQGLAFQTEVERKAQQLVKGAGGTLEVPAQRVEDFIHNRVGHLPKSSCPSGVIPVNLRSVYPERITQSFLRALDQIDKKLPGYKNPDALLHGVETRTSSPVRVVRDTNKLHCPRFTNLYPSGEGAGYAGGITSAAVDGIKVANAILDRMRD